MAVSKKLLDRRVANPDVDASSGAAWHAVADQREDELNSGTAEAVPLDLAVARLVARFS